MVGRLRADSGVCASPAAATTLPGMVTTDEKEAAARAAREAAQKEAIDAYVEELLAKAPPLTARQKARLAALLSGGAESAR